MRRPPRQGPCNPARLEPDGQTDSKDPESGSAINGSTILQDRLSSDHRGRACCKVPNSLSCNQGMAEPRRWKRMPAGTQRP